MRRGLVDEVDGLVGQEAVGDVAGRQLGRGLEGVVRDRQLVVLFVALADALEDLDRLFDARLLDQDGLEAALEGGVALDVLAVVVQRGCADALQLAAGQRGLEDVRGVDSAFGGAGADEHVHLVDEQHAVAGVLDLLDDLLQALLELTAVLRARDQRADVQREQALALQRLRHVAGHDALGQAFDDRRLADAGLADEDRVVLGAAREDLDQPLDLAAAADDRVELAGARGCRQVDTQLVDRRGAGAGATAAGALRRALGEDARRLGADALETTTSMSPRSVFTAFAKSPTDWSSVRSSGRTTASPPASRIRAATSSHFSVRRAPSATGKPCAPSTIAVAAPIPDEAPVTTADRRDGWAYLLIARPPEPAAVRTRGHWRSRTAPRRRDRPRWSELATPACAVPPVTPAGRGWRRGRSGDRRRS